MFRRSFCSAFMVKNGGVLKFFAAPNERDAVKYNYCAKSDTKQNFTTQYRIFNRNITIITLARAAIQTNAVRLNTINASEVMILNKTSRRNIVFLIATLQ